ncbi:hypothetical protein [uncultured Olegusella sp.]|uniref:hypothetical protein n=1 Tax=uncultured Olegusella sp. TaxID=1979846 RepID=UPI0026290C2B|nr:hypothetical protein [uncultured Olegusella sp.]
MLHRKINNSPLEVLAHMATESDDATTEQANALSGSISIDNPDGTRTVIGAAAGTDAAGVSRGIAPFVGDTTPPGKPTGIDVVSSVGTISVGWNGTLEGGIPADFDHVEVRANGNVVGSFSAAGIISIPGLPAGSQAEITLVAYDNAHAEDGTPAPNASEPSDPITVTVDNLLETMQQAQAQLDAMRQQAEEQAQAVQGLQSAVQSHYSEQSELASLVSDHTTSINQTAAQLQQVATKTEQIDGLSQRVENAESTITQTAESLEAKVSKGTSGVSSLGTIARLTANGLDIGSTLERGHAHIDDDEFSIFDANGNKTSCFTASEITLGANSDFTKVSMCKGGLRFWSHPSGTYISMPLGQTISFMPWVADESGEPMPSDKGILLQSLSNGGFILNIILDMLIINGSHVNPTHAAHLLAPVVLFDDAKPKLSGAVTLSDSLANYSDIEVFFSTNDGDAGGMTKIHNPNGKTFICQTTIAAPISETNRTWRAFVKTKVYMASGTTINTTQRKGDFATGEIVLTNGASNVTVKRYDAIGITRVVGWRK